MSRILIGALSGWKYHERRRRCLATWMADADAAGIEAVFLLGCPTAAQPEQIGPHALACPARTIIRVFRSEPCGSAAGHWKQGAGCKEQGADFSPRPYSTSALGWDYLFKCDDDTYVSIPRLLAYDLAAAITWAPNGSRAWATAAAGPDISLSRRAAELVAERLTQATGAEDLLVGQVLRAAGIALSIEPRLVPFGSMEHRPRRDNDLITLHGAEADAFLAAHAETG